ncbi:MAG: hypothetical protein WCS43_17750 [Verrucomicrobiota bacterium]
MKTRSPSLPTLATPVPQHTPINLPNPKKQFSASKQSWERSIRGISLLCGLAAVSAAMLGVPSYAATISFDERYVDAWNNGINSTLQAIGVTDLTISQVGARVYNINNENHFYLYQNAYGWTWTYVPGNFGQGIQAVPTGSDLTQSITFSFSKPVSSFSTNVFCVAGYTVTAISGGATVYTSTVADSGRNSDGTVKWGDIQVSGVLFDSVQVTGQSGAAGNNTTVYIDNVTFVPVPDTDNDGMPDAWEIANFGNLDQTTTGDYDHDGTDNLTEYRLGLDPKNGAERFAAILGSNGMLQWRSTVGPTFTVQRSTDLSNWGNDVTVTGSAGTATYTDPLPRPGKAFYRVLLQP